MASYEQKHLMSSEDAPDVNDEQQQTEKRQRRDVIITRIIYGVVGFIVLGVIAAVVVILITTFSNGGSRKTKFAFDAMFNSSLSPRAADVTWTFATTDAQEYYTSWTSSNVSCELRLTNANNVQPKTLVSNSALTANNIPCNTEYSVANGNTLVSFKLDITKIFRHSVLGRYVVYDSVQNTVTPVSPRQGQKQKTLVWCPAGRTLAYVENNNLFIKNFDTTKFPALTDAQVTTDGDEDTIFNGVTDWVYEEEVFGSVNAVAFSPDCTKLAFLKLNDSKVIFYEYDEYVQVNPYPQNRKIRIPVPGTPNPIPSVHVYDLAAGTLKTMDIGSNTDVYIYDLNWANTTTLTATRLNRLQNTKDLLLSTVTAPGSTLASTSVTVRTSPTWVQFARSVFFIPNTNGRYFVDVMPNQHGHFDIAYFDLQQAGSPGWFRFLLNNSNYDVLELYRAYNPTTNEIFFASTQTGSTDKHIFAVDLSAQANKRWLSANFTSPTPATPEENRGNGTVDAVFGVTGQNVVLFYQGPDVPKTVLLQVAPLTLVSTLENNDALRALRDTFDMPTTSLQTIKVGKENLNAMIVRPPGFSAGIQYPVLMNVYGGPGAQLVLSAYGALNRAFNLYVASLGFLVVTVDGRGTGGRGEAFMTQTYKQLGILETEDQIGAAKYLKTLPYVNPNAISIWGWSYGGYMTLMSVSSPLNQEGVFRLGMSVAPVTDWRLYDSAYTERYMQLPTADSNDAGYTNSSVLNLVADQGDATACKKNYPVGSNKKANGSVKTSLLIVHGTGDDNVHPLNSYLLMTRLQNCGVQFDTMFYPNKDHSIAGDATRKHLYRMLSNKLQNTILGSVSDDSP